MRPLTDALTTGQVARLCGVAPRTASKWIDSGMLPGWRVPGSQDRRVKKTDLIEFMRSQGVPTAGLMTTRVLCVDLPELAEVLSGQANVDVKAVDGWVIGGIEVVEWSPAVVVASLGTGTGLGTLRRILDGRQLTSIAVGTEYTTPNELAEAGEVFTHAVTSDTPTESVTRLVTMKRPLPAKPERRRGVHLTTTGGDQ